MRDKDTKILEERYENLNEAGPQPEEGLSPEEWTQRRNAKETAMQLYQNFRTELIKAGLDVGIVQPEGQFGIADDYGMLINLEQEG